MAVIIERDYDPQTVSNKFEVGERIEWVENIWFDRENNQHIVMGKGILENIRPRVVILAQEMSDGTVIHQRIERFYLQNWILDDVLLSAISKWEGSSHTQKREPTPRVKSDVPQTVYGLVDPRDGLVFYVGVTTNVQGRYLQHIDCTDTNFKKNAHIQDILVEGLYPEIIILEADIAASLADQRETYWIKFYLDLDAPLTNFAKMRGVIGRDIW